MGLTALDRRGGHFTECAVAVRRNQKRRPKGRRYHLLRYFRWVLVGLRVLGFAFRHSRLLDAAPERILQRTSELCESISRRRLRQFRSARLLMRELRGCAQQILQPLSGTIDAPSGVAAL